MSYRAIPVNAMLAVTKATASTLGLKLKVELSDHSIEHSYALPDKDSKAWDMGMYKNGNLFPKGYANPIKPIVKHNENLENPNEIDHKEGSPESSDGASSDAPQLEGETEGERTHVQLISSSRYRDYMRQDLVSQLLTPKEQWKLIAYGVLGLGILMFLSMIITLYVNGAF